MPLYFSKTTNGFYDVDAIRYLNPPADLVEITREQHAALMAAQAAGQMIAADAAGAPVAVDRSK